MGDSNERNVSKISVEYCNFLVDEYKNSLQVEPEDHPLGCWIPKKVPRKDGYVRINIDMDCFEHAGITDCDSKALDVYLHLISFKAKTGDIPDGKTKHVSHRCGIPACFYK